MTDQTNKDSTKLNSSLIKMLTIMSKYIKSTKLLKKVNIKTESLHCLKVERFKENTRPGI